MTAGPAAGRTAGEGLGQVPGALPEGVELRAVGCGHADWARALSVLLCGREAPRDARVKAFEGYAARAGMDLSGLRAAYAGGGIGETARSRVVAAGLAVVSPGRTAMVLVSPVNGGEATAVRAAGACVSATVSALPRGADGRPAATMAQCLLELEQTGPAEALESAGFHKLATLVYLQAELPRRRGRPVELPGVPTRDGAAVRLEAWQDTPEVRGRFGEAVLASYRDTADCPGLVGKRELDDIFAGHRGHPGTHGFDPRLWTVAILNDRPAAVLLLARLPEQDAMELVYLGVADHARGRGLGASLLRYSLAQTARHGARHLLLAVDEDNAPALRLYRSAGMTAQQRRDAWVKFLAPSA